MLVERVADTSGSGEHAISSAMSYALLLHEHNIPRFLFPLGVL